MRLLVSSLLAFWSAVALAGEALDFEFVSADGKLRFRTSTLIEDLARYNYESEEIRILLLETPSLDNPDYRKQDSLLASGHEEDLNVFFVVACPKEEYVSGYHTSKEVAVTLAGPEPKFRVRLLDEKGFILHESVHPISRETLRKWVRQGHNKTPNHSLQRMW